jgi:hypothetical protein
MARSREQVLDILYGLLKEAAVGERVDLRPELALCAPGAQFRHSYFAFFA